MSQQSILTVGIVGEGQKTYFNNLVQDILSSENITSSIQLFRSNDDLLRAVLDGHINVCACPLSDTPAILPTGLVITALSDRQASPICLVTEGGTFESKNDLKVRTLSDINLAQMQFLMPNYFVTSANDMPVAAIEALSLGKYDAVIMDQLAIKMLDLDMDKWHIQAFNMREFVPPVGSGVVSFIAAEDDLPTRRILKQIHHPSVSAATNIERLLQKRFIEGTINAYCERDRMGHYHVWATALVNGELRKTRVSQSTTFEMAQRVYELLCEERR